MIAPSVFAWKEGYPVPREVSVDEIGEIVDTFEKAARRAVAAGVDVVEIHAAHGKTIFEITTWSRTLTGRQAIFSAPSTPLSNRRNDAYGGSFENRIRISKEVAAAIRASVPDSVPLFYRSSSTKFDGELLNCQEV